MDHCHVDIGLSTCAEISWRRCSILLGVHCHWHVGTNWPCQFFVWTTPSLHIFCSEHFQKRTPCVFCGRRSRCQHAKTVRSEVYTYKACAHRALLGGILRPLQWRNCASEEAGLCWKKKLMPSFCYTPRGWFHLPHFYHIYSTVQSIKGRSLLYLNGTSHWWQSASLFLGGPWHNPCLAHLYWPPISLHWKKTSILPTSIRRSEIATYMYLPTQVAVPDLLSVVFALELVAGRRTKAQVKFRASSWRILLSSVSLDACYPKNAFCSLLAGFLALFRH